MRLLWLLGLIPLVAADYAVAFSIGQLPALTQEVNEINETCFLDEFQASLEASNWQRVNTILADCDFAVMSRGSVLSWFATPQSIIQEAQRQQQSATSQDIIQEAQQQQILGFHALRQIQQNVRHEDVSVELIEWLVGQVATLGANEASQSFSGESEAGSNEAQNQDLNEALQAIAAETLGLFTTAFIEQTGAPQVFEASSIINFSVSSDSETGVDPISVLLSLTSSGSTSSGSTSPRVNLAALQALRDIGRALQGKVDEARLAEADIDIQDSGRTTWHGYRRTLEDQMSQAMLAGDSSSSEGVFRADQQLFTAVQVARVETLSAFLFISFDDPELANAPNRTADQLCRVELGTSLGERPTDRGLQFLNCLSAQAAWESASGETVEIDSSVRAAAIAELERLATIPTFRQELARQLRNLAVALQWEQERQRQEANADLSQQDEALLNAQRALLTARSISAVESQGRADTLPNPPQPQPQSIQEQRTQARQAERYFIDDDLASASLLSLLAGGLNSANRDELSELQQRAEIAFNDVYGQDLNLITRAINYADGSGNDDIQKNAVAALGAVSYRNLSAATDLTPIAQFLGQSLLCHEDAEVRRDAAFALGQLAPYHLDLFQNNLVDPEQAPFRYRLISDNPPESWGRQLVDICQSIAGDDAESTQVDAESPKIIDALTLRLSDREENIVVAAAYALSQYGIALENRSNQTEFLRPITNEVPQADSPVSELKTCMMALVSPTRYDDWPEDLTDQSLLALVEKTEEYVETCPYLLPEENQDEEAISTAAISAAFVLGQVGITDGHPEATDTERALVAHLLRSLQGRDLLAQLAAGTSTPARITAVTPLQGAYPYREDSVRDGIVSYALGQIHPREDALIQQLISAILFEQPLGSENANAVRTLSCTDVVPTGNEDYFACIEDPITRAAVVGAIEIIGIEARPDAENDRPDAENDRPDAENDRPDAFPAERRARVSHYVERLRQLLTQDVSPALTEAVVTAVIERMVSISGLLDVEPEADDQPTQNADGRQSNPENSTTSAENPSTSESFSTARYVLGASLTSIYSCSGASLGLARLGVYNTATIDQLVHHLYAFPEPLTRLAPVRRENNRFDGNFCVPALPEAEAEQTSDDLPSRLEQLVILKTGAIAALGSIGLNSADDPPVSHRYSRTAVEGHVVTQNPLYTDQDVKNVIACLVDIANLEMLAFANLEMLTFHNISSTTCNQVFANKEPAIQERPNNPTDFPDTELSPAERSRAIRAQLHTDAINEGQLWGLTADEMIQAHELGLTMADRAYAKLHDVPIDFLRKGLEDDRISLTVDDLIRGWRFGLRSVDEFVDGRRRGLLVPEVIQAAKWGLTPQEFFILKVRLQEPAIAAIGQLAIIETGQSRTDLAALEALSLAEQESEQQITGRSEANLQGLSLEHIKILKLRNLEAVLLALQEPTDTQTLRSSINTQDRSKIEYIISEYLIDELAVDQDEYRVKGDINDYFEDSDEGLGTIKSEEIEALADGLAQEVERLVRSYRRALEQIPEDLAQDFPDPSSTQYKNEKQNREAALSATYTDRLQQRAEELWAYDQAFRDEVLKVLVSLDSKTISNLSQGTRQDLITGLGIGRRPERLAQQCLSAEDDLFTQERLCNGLARLLTAALNSNYLGVSPETVDNGTAFLQTLATDPEQETEQAIRFNSSQLEIERSSSVIRSSGIEYLGQLEIGYASSPALPNILLARLADEDEQVGVREYSIQTYYASDPETGVRSLIQALNSNDGNITTQQAAAQMVARLGQRAYRNPDTAEEAPITIDDIPNLGARRFGNDDYRWQRALQNQALVAVLMRIAEDSTISSELRADAIAALGSIRTTNASAIDLVQKTLINLYGEANLEMQIAAAYALGNIGQSNPTRVGELQANLLNVVRIDSEEANQLSEEEANQLRTAAAFALSQLNASNALNRLQQFEVVYALVALFGEIQGASPGEGELLVSFNTRRALILAALSQFDLNGIVNSGGSRPSLAERNLLERVAETYAAGINTDNPLAVRVMAVARARDLPVWSDDLVDALVAATQDANPAIRLAAVETIRLRQGQVLENSSRFDVLEPDVLSYQRDLVEALAAVFWNSQEYGIIRLPAGQALADELGPEEQGTLTELGIDPRSLPFADILVALENLEEFSASFRDSSGILRGSDAILQALRSDSLLAQLDPLFSEQLLFEILEAIRTDTGTPTAGGGIFFGTSPAPICSIPIVRRACR